MWKWLGLAVIFMLGLATQAQAQTPFLQWQCVAPSASKPGGGYCPVNSTYPLPTSAAAGGSVSISGALPTGNNTIGRVNYSPLPKGATGTGAQIAINATFQTAGNTVTVSDTSNPTFLPALCKLDVLYTGSTAAGLNSLSISGAAGQVGTLQYAWPTPAAAGVFQAPFTVNWSPCLQASSSAGLSVSLSPQPAGATAGSVNAYGYSTN